MTGRLLALVAIAFGLGVFIAGGVALGDLRTCGVQAAGVAAVSSYQVKFSYEKSDGNRAIITTVVQAKSTTAAQRQVKAAYKKVNIITIKKL